MVALTAQAALRRGWYLHGEPGGFWPLPLWDCSSWISGLLLQPIPVTSLTWHRYIPPPCPHPSWYRDTGKVVLPPIHRDPFPIPNRHTADREGVFLPLGSSGWAPVPGCSQCASGFAGSSPEPDHFLSILPNLSQENGLRFPFTVQVGNKTLPEGERRRGMQWSRALAPGPFKRAVSEPCQGPALTPWPGKLLGTRNGAGEATPDG